MGDASDSATEHNAELETATKAASEVRKSLGSISSTAAGRKISNLVKDCEKGGTELIALLRYIRDEEGRAKGKPKSTARLFCRTLREKKTIEKLENKLKSREKQLNDILAQTVYINVEEIRSKLEQLSLKLHTDLTKIVDTMSRSQPQLESSITNARDDLKAHLRNLSKEAQVRHTSRKNAELGKSLLDVLAFSDMNQRRYSVATKTAPGTAEWIFDMTADTGQPKWANFDAWLREDSSVYWISGKAGSGKSTLVANIVEDERTRAGLESWSGGQQVQIMSFYFWRPGSELQKSVTGLLRSLLHQICAAHPLAMDSVLASASPARIRSDWHQERYALTVRTAMLAASDSKFCLFIDGLDGLDDYEGSCDDLIDLIFDLQSLRNVKCCVSSRPEVNLCARLKGCKRLHLEDYNESDIFFIVDPKIPTREWASDLRDRNKDDESTRTKFLGHVAIAADGIFLWATVMVRSLITGIRSGDDLPTLYSRTNQMPKELGQLFAQMMESVSDVHKRSLALVFQSLKLQPQAGMLDVCTLTMLRMDVKILSRESFGAECQRTKAQIWSQSAGLLGLFGSGVVSVDKWRAANKRHCALTLCRDKVRIPSELNIHGLHRREVDSDHPYRELLVYEEAFPAWCHRSAYDFILPSHNVLASRCLLH